jgi:hypothetical protein
MLAKLIKQSKEFGNALKQINTNVNVPKNPEPIGTTESGSKITRIASVAHVIKAATEAVKTQPVEINNLPTETDNNPQVQKPLYFTSEKEVKIEPLINGLDNKDSITFINDLHFFVSGMNNLVSDNFERNFKKFSDGTFENVKFEHNYLTKIMTYLRKNKPHLFENVHTKENVITIDLPKLDHKASLFGKLPDGKFILAGNLNSLKSEDFEKMYAKIINNN